MNALLVGHDVDIYATGSHSQMLAPEISAHLAGRYVCIPIYPLSFAECLAFGKTFAPPQDPHAELANYLRLGGFPAVHLRRLRAYTMVVLLFHHFYRGNEARQNPQPTRWSGFCDLPLPMWAKRFPSLAKG